VFILRVYLSIYFTIKILLAVNEIVSIAGLTVKSNCVRKKKL